MYMIFLSIGCRQEALDCCPIFLKLPGRENAAVTILEVNGKVSAFLLRLPRKVIVYNLLFTLGTAIISGIFKGNPVEFQVSYSALLLTVSC